MRVTRERQPQITEGCVSGGLHPDGFYSVPAAFLESNSYGALNAQLMGPLQQFAGDPVGLLGTAAVLQGSGQGAKALALADTVATGRVNYGKLKQGLITRAAVVTKATQLGGQNVEASVDVVLERVYRVAWTLEGLAPRANLGWVGVCAAVDPPRRPVNVPASPFPQFDIRVDVKARGAASAQTIDTRFTVCRAGLVPGSTVPVEQGIAQRQLPVLVVPQIPDDARIILFVHGHTSRAEECLPLAQELFDEGFTVISVDLPGAAYATQLNPTDVGPPPNEGLSGATSGPYSALDHLEQFLCDFVDELDDFFGWDISKRIVGVVGGSMGGNLGLRLSERKDHALWRQSVAAWSPASVWGLSWARARITVDEPGEYMDALKFGAVTVTRDRMNQAEGSGYQVRREYFQQVFYGFQGQPAQADRWYRDDWEPCKAKYKAGAEADRQEIYTPLFRKWNWRVAHEQLCFMHQEPPAEGQLPRFESIRSRVLLGACGEDNALPERLWENTKELAEQSIHVQGQSFFVLGTGHSIVAERPRELAAELSRFLFAHSPDVTGVEPFGTWTLLGGDPLRPDSLAVCANEDGRLELFGIRASDSRLVSQRQQTVNGTFPAMFEDIGVSRGVPAGVTFTSRLVALPLHGGTTDGGRLRLYARRSDQNGWIVHLTQDVSNGVMRATNLGNQFGQLLGGITAGPVACERLGWTAPANEPQRLHLVGGIHNDGTVRIRGQTVTGFPDSYWTTQPNLGPRTFVGTPALGRSQNGAITLAARTSAGEVWQRTEGANDTWPTDWTRVGTLLGASDPALIRDWQGRMNLFVTSGGTLRRSVRVAGAWGEWEDLGGQVAAGARPAVAIDAWGSMEVFVRTAGNRLAYRRQLPSTSFEWPTWEAWIEPSSATLTSDPVVAANVDGSLAVFVLGNDGRARVIRHRQP